MSTEQKCGAYTEYIKFTRTWTGHGETHDPMFQVVRLEAYGHQRLWEYPMSFIHHPSDPAHQRLLEDGEGET